MLDQSFFVFMDTLSMGIVIYTDELPKTIFYTNNAMLDLLGYEKEDALNKCALSFVLEQDWVRVNHALENQLETTGNFIVECRVVNKQGQIIWVSISGCKMVDKDKNVFIYMMIFDIGETKQLQIQTQEKMQNLEFINQTVPGGIVCLEQNETFDIVYANHGYYEIIGYSKEELDSKFDNSAILLMYPEDLVGVITSLNQQLQKGNKFYIEGRIVNKNKELVWIGIEGIRIALKNETPKLYCLLLDISISANRKIQLEKKKKQIETITNNILCGISTLNLDNDFTFDYISDGYLNLVGYTKKQLCDELENKSIRLIHSLDRQRVTITIKEQLLKSDDIDLTYRINKRNDEIIWVLFKGKKITDENGKVTLSCVTFDNTAEYMAQSKLQLEREENRIVLGLADDIIFTYDIVQSSIRFSDNFKKRFDIDCIFTNFPEVMVINNMIYKEDIPAFLSFYKEAQEGKISSKAEIRIQRRNGDVIWYKMEYCLLCDETGKPYRAIGRMVDIDGQKKEIEQFSIKAQTDPLTNIYNKTAIRERIEKALAEDDEKDICAFFIIDIDNFKGVNDNLGHMFGDAVLVDIASKIKKRFREIDIIGRIGGDEFVVFVKKVTSQEMVEKKAQDIAQA
ncbi:MAG: PAS domain-containing protein, partial [Oscillospiraceae bacterium]